MPFPHCKITRGGARRLRSRLAVISDRAALLVGTNGIAIKRVDGEIEFISTRDIFGLTVRP